MREIKIIMAVAIGLLLSVFPARAQFLRLGPFDLTAQSQLEAIYTTNVEGERPSVAKKEMTDYYLIASLNLLGQAKALRSTVLNLDSGIAIEKHFVRSDLDNSSNPFGALSLRSTTELGHYRLQGEVIANRTYKAEEDTYVPGGATNKTRDVTDSLGYGGELSWQRQSVKVSGSYQFRSERHQDEQFKNGDRDETTIRFNGEWAFWKDASVAYENSRTRTDLPNSPITNQDWKVTESIRINYKLPLLKRPALVYSFGLEKQDTDEEKGKWDPTHTLSLDDAWNLSSPFASLRLAVNASYQYEKNPESDDVSFRYGGILTHDISRTAQEQLTADREPVRTFGSTTKTDTTKVKYSFTKQDLFMYNLNLLLSAMYEHSVPLDDVSPPENRWTYEGNLRYSRLVTRRLDRTLEYKYSLETSNLADEPLEEHRVTLKYRYTF